MKEREILQQLHDLKSFTPRAEWKDSSRSVLLSQISGQSETIELTIWQKIFDCQFVEWVSQPSVIILTVLLLLIGGGASGMVVAQNAKPGDSLYIAKMISEKTRATITLNDQDKVKLNMEFASNRIKEMEQILCDASQPADSTAEKVVELEKNFKKEIANAKDRIENIEKDQQAKEKQNTKIADKPKTTEAKSADKNNPQPIFSANLEKTNQGMQTTDSPTALKTNIESNCQGASQSTSTKSMLDEAEKLFADKNYKGAVDKLNQASSIIGSGNEVKTGTEQASSTK